MLPKVRRALLLLLPPVTAAYLMQFVLGVAPWRLAPGIVLANALCFGALYYLLCAATGSYAKCCFATHVIAASWGAANSFVITFRGTPILPWDFTALSTAGDVLGSYTLTPTWQMIAAIVLMAALWYAFHRTGGKEPLRSLAKGKAARIVCLALGLIGVLLIARPGLLEKFGVKTDVWNPAGAYRTSGALASFLRNTEFLEVEKPEDDSLEGVERILSAVEPLPAAQVGLRAGEKPNIIAIMNESWADFEHYGNITLSESVTDYIGSLDNAIRGHAYTSVFGAGTSASEFEFLTGNSMAFLPSGSIPYQQYILSESDSMASLLRENGYRTLAFHPGEYTSWQRNTAYPRLGFDDYKCGEDMDVPAAMEHGYVSDKADFEQVIYEFEHKAPGERLFLFNVTIQNHGGYAVAGYPTEVTLTDAPGRYPLAEQYLTLCNKTDEAFRTLVEYFSAQEEPTIILMFGDHQPSVEQEFLDKAYGVTQDGMTMEQYMGRFQVPYVIWANYDLPEEDGANTCLNFLGQRLLRYAGVEASRYGQFLQSLERTLKAVTFVGYTDGEGNAYSHLETNAYTALIEAYRQVQYNNLFGGKERLDEAFCALPLDKK
ncbi:MAG: LTA synthase family protein [Oscillospiraceae bacterium]|nr:LTA synthase family protein [Oscillospiraceae bacterium]